MSKFVKGEIGIKAYFLIPSPALKNPSLTLTVPFPDNTFPSKEAPRVPRGILKNPPFRSFVSFLIVLVTPFNRISKSSKAWTIFIISFISSVEIFNVVVPEPSIFFVFQHQQKMVQQ